MRIALDGMGGDSAPGVVVEGAVEAVNEFNCEILLVGQEDVLKSELSKYTFKAENIKIEHAPQVVEMDESPIVPIRSKKDSSISIAVNLVKERKADAVISAGNTGATV